MYTYIIFEDGSISQIENISEEDKQNCEDGYCNLLQTETSLRTYFDGKWNEITFEEEK